MKLTSNKKMNDKLMNATANTESPSDNINREMIKETLYNLLKKVCTYKKRRVIIYRYIQNKTLTETSRIFSLSLTRIQQIEYKALRKMRHPKYNTILGELRISA